MRDLRIDRLIKTSDAAVCSIAYAECRGAACTPCARWATAMGDAAMSVQFQDRPFTLTQPDGSKLSVRGSGNQFRATFETLDGKPVMLNPQTGWYGPVVPQPAGLAAAAGPALAEAGLFVQRSPLRREPPSSPLARRCDQRRAERQQEMRSLRALGAAGGPLLAPPQRQTVGDFVGLCLLIDFVDEPATIPREEVERFCNLPGYNGFGNQGSVRDFFMDNSVGRCRYTNVVAPYYRAKKPIGYYTDESIEMPIRAWELIGEALAHHKAAGFDFTPLTADSQGFVYAMNVFYAGEVRNSWAQGLWPHAHRLESVVPLMPGKGAFDYQFTAMTSELTLGTFCHENGHMLCDYPDLYDDEQNAQSSGVGMYCLMCAGNFDEKNPTTISAYLKRLSGWANQVIPLEHDQVVELKAGSNDMAIHSRSGREYFLVENRQRSGRDGSLGDSGLAIWHVDETGDNSQEQMTPARHYELSLEQADGLFQLERSRGHRGDQGDLYKGPAARFADDTTPSSRWWNGAASNLTIDQISASEPTMSFRSLFGTGVAPDPLRQVVEPDLAIPDNDAAGIRSTIQVQEDVAIASIKIGLRVAHTFVGDLRVTLETPWGATVELHPKGLGGNAQNLDLTYDEAMLPALATLRGRSSRGTWTLRVQDLGPRDVGRLQRWGLDLGAPAALPNVVVLKESPGTAIPDNSAAGIVRTLNNAQAFTLESVEVAVEIAHSWIGDLEVGLMSPAGSQVTLHARAGGSAHDLNATYTAATTPGLATLAGQPAAGAWKLRIADREAQDAGKLSGWRLTLKA
ncbi:M6 family metalloprotease domain-containing protein [Variovorax sp. J22R115]|uniref:M6 family metalloprotease domain-containing protein n=1 Tax=Variovorax sp. J22R115 TaxID=3053509 RepID=UPI0025786EA9|nr:M6 family metalloprotease domain-containing protein [Variovorax sp. J22R115]MDM0053524.1 M6 family metalloprotease domain-containing protein [Variovorax sp. J22R115]